MLRLFVGIGFPPELKLQLSLLCHGLPGARWVSPDNFHLTLRFIGETGEDVAAGIGLFASGERPRTLWVGVERHPELVALRDKIEQALIRIGLPPESRKFAPHVTLARLNNPPRDKLCDFLAAHALFRAAPLAVEGFSLIASFPTKTGAIYEDQAEYPLAG